MRKSGWVVLAVVLAAVVAPVVALRVGGGGGWLRERFLELHGRGGAALHGTATHRSTATSDVAVPFELVNGHVMLRVTVNDSGPLWFILDTGDKYGLIDRDRAARLKLPLGANVEVHGVGPATTPGAFVKDATFRIAGLPDFSQDVKLAIPLTTIAAQFGHDVDGIIGADFISEFVVEIDYAGRVITLHDKRTFQYQGTGESLPIRLNHSGHPIVHAAVTPVGGQPIDAEFAFDVGASGSLALNSPFVKEHGLPGATLPTVRSVGTGGTGGGATGRVGRIAALRLGHVTLVSPIVLFSDDSGGAFAGTDDQGNIGYRIISRFRVFLDYGHDRIILEPTSAAGAPFDVPTTGLALNAEGPEYHVFRVTDVRESSAATDAGVKKDDVITACDGRDANTMTLTSLLEQFEQPRAHSLSVRRGDTVIKATLTPKAIQ